MSCSDLIDIPGELLSHLSAGEILFSSRFSLNTIEILINACKG